MGCWGGGAREQGSESPGFAEEAGEVKISLQHPRNFAIELRRGKAKENRKLGLEVSAPWSSNPLGFCGGKVRGGFESFQILGIPDGVRKRESRVIGGLGARI